MLRWSSHLTFGIGLLIVFNFLSWVVLSMTISLNIIQFIKDASACQPKNYKFVRNAR